MIALSDPVLLAVVALIAGSSAPLGALALSRINGKQRADEALAAQKVRADERQLDYDRADALADRVQAQADRLVANQATQSAHLLASNEHIAQATAATSREVLAVKEQGQVIHGLVNASYTAALEAQRVALVGQLESKRALTEMRTAAGLPAMPETDIAIAAIVKQIHVLEASIKDRLEKQHLAEDQVQAAKDNPTTPTSENP